MWELTQFDAQLSRRLPRGTSTRRDPSPALRPLLLLIDPWGEPVAEFARQPSDAQVLKAAHRLAPQDWCGVLADEAIEAGGRGGRPQWRLALLRAARAEASGELQWLSPALPAPAGRRPAQLLSELRAAAVQQLWRHGWRLRA